MNCGIPPAIELSGMPELRGGGGTESSVSGRYAVVVTSFRFEDSLVVTEEVNWRVAYGHACECFAAA